MWEVIVETHFFRSWLTLRKCQMGRHLQLKVKYKFFFLVQVNGYEKSISSILIDLYRDGGFDDPNSTPLFHCFVAEENDISKGYVTCLFILYMNLEYRQVTEQSNNYIKPFFVKKKSAKTT